MPTTRDLSSQGPERIGAGRAGRRPAAVAVTVKNSTEGNRARALKSWEERQMAQWAGPQTEVPDRLGHCRQLTLDKLLDPKESVSDLYMGIILVRAAQISCDR